jgi:pyruvate kinase
VFTDIVCTLGPTSSDPSIVEAMARAGMTIVRSNFSHCSHDEFAERIQLAETMREKGLEFKMLADLQGPRIRVKNIPEAGITVQAGQSLVFVTHGKEVADGQIGMDDPHLHNDILSGEKILVANGAIETVVREVHKEKQEIHVEVINDGVIYPNKGLNFPMTRLTTSALTEKDRRDIEFLKTQPVDFVALSFVQSAEDVRELRSLLGDSSAKIVVKVERQEAVKNIDEILEEADAIMVARGDLGVEVPYFEVPIIQKRLIRKANLYRKPVIVATQMLLTMVREPSPTRAEISDIANAVFDGAHAVMLSDETANGKYPVEAVKTMAKVVRHTEQFLDH